MTAVVPATSSDELAPAFSAAREICRRHARSFYFASYFLPAGKRAGAYSVYAFCRMIDDAIDEGDESIVTASGMRAYPAVVSPVHVGAAMSGAGGSGGGCSCTGLEERLGMFRDRLDEIYTHRLELPAVAGRSEAQHALCAFSYTVHQYGIPKQYFLDLAEGCRMDLTVMRYPTWGRLEKYCYHVAGVVGLIMSAVFGLQNSGAAAQAVKMGNAMQLTNILRDVKEDRDRGRIYLPLEDMVRFGYSERDLAASVVNEAFGNLMKFEIERARTMFREGAEGLCWLAEDGSRLTASAMAVIYSGILGAIERQNYDVFSRRASISLARKLGRVPACWKLARRLDGQAVPDVF